MPGLSSACPFFELLVKKYKLLQKINIIRLFFLGPYHIITIIILGIFVIACSEPVDDEAQIRTRIASMVASTEAKELSSVLDPVHKDFLGNGRIRRANLKGLVLLHFRRNKNVHVIVNNLEVELENTPEPNRAKVKCNLVLAGRNQTLPETGRVLQLESAWQKAGGEWFVISAKWRDPVANFMN